MDFTEFLTHLFDLLTANVLKQATNKEHAEVRVTNELVLVQAQQGAEEAVGALVMLHSQSVRTSHDRLAVEFESGVASLVLRAEAHIGGAGVRVLTEKRNVGNWLLDDGSQRLITLEQLHDMRLLEVVRQFVNVEIRESLSLRRGTVARHLTLRLGQLLVLRVVTRHNETVRVRLHVAIVPGGNAQVGSLTAIKIDKRKSLGIVRILIDNNLKDEKNKFIISKIERTVEFTYDCAQNEVVQATCRVYYRLFLRYLFLLGFAGFLFARVFLLSKLGLGAL